MTSSDASADGGNVSFAVESKVTQKSIDLKIREQTCTRVRMCMCVYVCTDVYGHVRRVYIRVCYGGCSKYACERCFVRCSKVTQEDAAESFETVR